MNKTNRNLIIATIVMIALIITTVVGGYAAGIISPSKSGDISSEETSLFGSTANASETKSNETLSAEDMNEAQKEEIRKNIKEAPDLKTATLNVSLNKRADELGLKKLENGQYAALMNFESMPYDLNAANQPSNDMQRASWGKQAGFVTYEITEAFGTPYAFTEAQANVIKCLQMNEYANFSDEEKRQFEIQAFKAFAANPNLFAATMRLMANQKIASDEKIGDHWLLWQQFKDDLGIDDEGNWTRKEDGSLSNPDGVAIFCYDREGKTYTGNHNYFKYVMGYLTFMENWEVGVARFEAAPGNHLPLDIENESVYRIGKNTTEPEYLPSIVWIYRVKNGKIALIFGTNVVDKRPEVLNYMIMPRQTAETTTPAPAKSGGSSGGSGSYTPQPFEPTPTPGPTPGPTPTPEHKKHPSDDAANAVTDWNDDDPGSGEHRADTGNSKSQTVEGSGGHAYTVVNHDGANPSNYNPGSAAGYTDNGAVPDTSAPENQVGIGDGVNHNTVNGGQSTTSTTNSGSISAPPA